MFAVFVAVVSGLSVAELSISKFEMFLDSVIMRLENARDIVAVVKMLTAPTM